MTSALLLVCRLTGCLTGCVWRGTRSIHLHYQRHWTVLPTISELPQRSDLSKQEIRLNFYCYCTFFCLLERGGEKDALTESCQTTELRSFCPKVDSPDGVRREISRFARWHSTLYNMVNIPSEVFSYPWIPHVRSLSFYAYSLFSGLKNDKYASGEST